MKVDLSTDELDTWGYDRNNGQDAAQHAIDALRGTSDPNNILIRAQHASATQGAAEDVLRHISDQSELTVIEDTVHFHLGFDNVADILRPKVEESQRKVKSPLE